MANFKARQESIFGVYGKTVKEAEQLNKEIEQANKRSKQEVANIKKEIKANNKIKNKNNKLIKALKLFLNI